MAWVNVNFEDGTTAATGENWIEDVNRVVLAPQVPDEIRRLFEFAKNALGYGYFYYPLFTLVAQQLLRVADIAVDVLFDVRAITPKPQSLHRRIEILYERGLISGNAHRNLDLLRAPRNRATHDAFRTIMLPTQAISDIHWIAQTISDLPWP